MRLAHGILIADASIQFGIQIFKERRQHCGVETDALNRWERCLITRARYEFRRDGRIEGGKELKFGEPGFILGFVLSEDLLMV